MKSEQKIEMIIRGIGYQLPKYSVDNQYFERFLDTSDEWIKTRTGISKRYFALPFLGDTINDLAISASQKACEMANVRADSDIDFIICGTLSPNKTMPSMACCVQDALKIKKGFAFDLNAACAGFVYGLTVAERFIASGMYKRGLVIGAETLSSITNMNDRSTCVLFGDAAGAVVVEAKPTKKKVGQDFKPLFCSDIESNGAYGDVLEIPAGHSAINQKDPRFNEKLACIHMKGNELFKVAVRFMKRVIINCLEKANLTSNDIDWLIPHQANLRIIDKLAAELNFPKDKVYINMDRVGNTSAASIPLAVGMAYEEGVLKNGQRVLSAAFGGGLNYGACVFTLDIPKGESS